MHIGDENNNTPVYHLELKWWQLHDQPSVCGTLSSIEHMSRTSGSYRTVLGSN